MTGRKPFDTLRAGMTPEARARVTEKTAALRAEMPLQELRAALRLSQAQLGELLQVEQPAVAKLEKRTDMYVSTLRRVIEAMGGRLHIVAEFPDGEVEIANFADTGKTPRAASE
jgi:DNA-binding XRE family transcriptional regulator